MAAATRLISRLTLVTGGGSGIGRAVCQRLASEGASVVVADISEESANETLGSLSTLVEMHSVSCETIQSRQFQRQFIFLSSFKNHCRCSSLCGAFMVYGAFISCLCCGCCLQVGNIGQANYAASKAGVEGLTRTAAKELSRFGIRCNCVLEAAAMFVFQIESLVPLGRMGEPAEVADVCAFLASDDSRYITGASIEVAGAVSL
uniref:Estradiol 17-beta-dehydrogenase 8-like n=1 Tax=Pundamilia nyererei TaxID=303518 RepID=A0A3B4G2D1_9CICH